jgi:hypothetical protein
MKDPQLFYFRTIKLSWCICACATAGFNYTLITSACSHMLIMPSLAASADGHNANLKFGSYERMLPDFLAILIAAIWLDLQGSEIKLIDP